jgi:hypothetical protein
MMQQVIAGKQRDYETIKVIAANDLLPEDLTKEAGEKIFPSFPFL